MGIEYDRQWLVVNDEGMFVAQRGDGKMGIPVKSMCLIETAIEGDHLILTAPDMGTLSLPLAGLQGASVEVQVWKSQCNGIYQGDEAARWFTNYLSRERKGNYRLVRMADDGVRASKRGQGHLAFADAYPFLIISQASLDDLNSRLPEALPMNRFRPNIVVSGCEAYSEDRWAQINIGGITFNGTTLCVRCPITTTDQLTGIRGKEPLKTLATYRRTDDGVVFGRNFNHDGLGTISIGDTVIVLAQD